MQGRAALKIQATRAYSKKEELENTVIIVP